MKSYTERLQQIGAAAWQRIEEFMSYVDDDFLFEDGIEAEFNSDMNGIVGYTIRAIIGGSFYCCDEEGNDIEELQDNYNAIMDIDELTPYGRCLFADGLCESNYAEEFKAVYDEAMAYLRGLDDDEVVSWSGMISLCSEIDYDPWVTIREYDRCTNIQAEAHNDLHETLLEDFLYDELVRLADEVKRAKGELFDYIWHLNANAQYIIMATLYKGIDEDYCKKFLSLTVYEEAYDMAPEYVKEMAAEFTDRECYMFDCGIAWNEEHTTDYESAMEAFLEVKRRLRAGYGKELGVDDGHINWCDWCGMPFLEGYMVGKGAVACDADCMQHIVSTEQGIPLEEAAAWFDHQSCELNDGHYFTSMYL